MARDGSGNFSYTSGTQAVSNSPTNSGHVNTRFEDLKTDANAARPITAGGTGATNATAALVNLGLTATAAEINTLDGITATVDELNIMDGVTMTAAEINAIGEIYLTTLTASDSSELAFTAFDATKYTGYVFRCYNLLPATDGASLRWRASTDGGSSYLAGTNYSQAFTVGNDDSADSSLKSTGDSSVRVSGNLGNDTNESGYTGELQLFGPDRTQYKTLTQLGGYVNSTGNSRGISGAALIKTNTAVNAVRFFMETGAPAETNITSGVIKVFGVRGA